MFADLLRNELFRAYHLATDIEECKWIREDYDRIPDQETIQLAIDNTLTNLVVMKTEADKQIPVGYVQTEKVRNRKLTNEDVTRLDEQNEWIIDGNLPLVEVARKFCTDGISSYSLYFISYMNRISGIMTYADLNRKSVYLYTYAQILFLEHRMKNDIAFAMRGVNRPRDEWTRVLETETAKFFKPKEGTMTRHKELVAQARTENEAPVSFCDLPELRKIIEGDPHIRGRVSLPISADSIDFACKIRNRVAHPIRLLVPNRKAEKILPKLIKLWSELGQFMQNNDLNDKNRSLSI